MKSANSWFFGIIILGAAVLSAPRVGQATPFVAYDSMVTPANTVVIPYVVSTTDLLQTPALASTSSTGDFTYGGAAGGVPVLNDGAFLDAGPQFPQTALTNGGNTLTYVFSNPLGYVISGITSYSGWDAYLGGQNYTVKYDTVSDPGNYHTIASPSINLDNVAGWGSSRVTITDSTGALGTAVHSLQFDFNAINFGPAGYREIDVFGIPVPEPCTLVLGGLGGVGLLFVAARRRKA